MSLVAEIRRIPAGEGERLRVDLFDDQTELPSDIGLVHTAGRVNATDTEEAHVRAALEVLGIQERATVAS